MKLITAAWLLVAALVIAAILLARPRVTWEPEQITFAGGGG